MEYSYIQCPINSGIDPDDVTVVRESGRPKQSVHSHQGDVTNLPKPSLVFGAANANFTVIYCYFILRKNESFKYLVAERSNNISPACHQVNRNF